jgi:hypothetical protein
MYKSFFLSLFIIGSTQLLSSATLDDRVDGNEVKSIIGGNIDEIGANKTGHHENHHHHKHHNHSGSSCHHNHHNHHSHHDTDCLCPQGERGPRGRQGEQGIQGPHGRRGPIGAQGPIGPQGATGETGSFNTNNFASLRLFSNETINRENPIAFLDIPTVETFFGGDLSLRAGHTVDVGQAGNFKITYGISALADQRVRLIVDGRPLKGSILSCASDGQMTSQTVIAPVLKGISLQAVDLIELTAENSGDVTAFLEVFKLNSEIVNTTTQP